MKNQNYFAKDERLKFPRPADFTDTQAMRSAMSCARAMRLDTGDVLGSYTGTANDRDQKPVQDADDI